MRALTPSRSVTNFVHVICVATFVAGCAGTASQLDVKKIVFVKESTGKRLDYLQIEFPERMRRIVVSGKPVPTKGKLAEFDLGTALEQSMREQAELYYDRVDIVERSERNVTPLIRVINLTGSMNGATGAITIGIELWAKSSYDTEPVTMSFEVDGGSEYGGGGAFAKAAAEGIGLAVFGVDSGGYAWQQAANWGNRAVSSFNSSFASFVDENLYAVRVADAPTRPARVIPDGNVPHIDMGSYVYKRLEPSGVAGERRVALVIGNAAYHSNPLKNPGNDARDLAFLLSSQGFEVDLHINAELRQFDEAVTSFGGSLERGGVGFFYYAGHAVQVGGANYLLPINHEVNSEADIKYKAFNAARVMEQMGYARNGLNIVVLDACRDNPLPKTYTRSASRGLTIAKDITSARGMFVAFATEPGNVAKDGDADNGLYTSHLLKALRQPGREIELVFKDVLRGVKEESGGTQVPWTSSSFDGEFIFQR